VKIINGALVNFKSPNPIQRWKKRRKRQSAISSAKLMKVVPSSLSIPVHLFSPLDGPKRKKNFCGRIKGGVWG
jgi:hypothetical protein